MKLVLLHSEFALYAMWHVHVDERKIILLESGVPVCSVHLEMYELQIAIYLIDFASITEQLRAPLCKCNLLRENHSCVIRSIDESFIWF